MDESWKALPPASGIARRCVKNQEIGVVAVAAGHALDDLDLVVDALAQVGTGGPLAVRQDAGKVGLEWLHLRLSPQIGDEPTKKA